MTHGLEIPPSRRAISPVEALRMKYSPGEALIIASRCCLPSSSVGTCLIHTGVPSSSVLKMSKPKSMHTSGLLMLDQQAAASAVRGRTHDPPPPIYTAARELDVQP